MSGSLQRLASMGWRNLTRNLRRTVITVLALAGSLALASASWVLIEGYLQSSIDAMIGGSAGHFQVVHPGQLEAPNLFDVVEDPAAVMAEAREQPAVLAVTPRVQSAVLLAAGERSVGAELWGLDPQTEGEVSDWPRRVAEGRFVEGPGELVLGLGLARELRIGLGAEVLAVGQGADGSLANALWTVVGLADLGSDMANRSQAWVSVGEAQEFLVLDGVHLVVGRVESADEARSVVMALVDRPGWSAVIADLPVEEQQAPQDPELTADIVPVDPQATLVARSWRAISPFMAQMSDLGRSWTLIGVLLVLVTAGMGTANTMLMSVTERTRELGILMALGLRPAQVVGLVLFESLALFAWSTVGGLILGAGLRAYLVEFGLDYRDSSGDWVMGGVAMEPVIYGRYSAEAFWAPVLLLLIVTLTASLIPALRAARLDPVRAMHARA